jgi:hypothetical protein
VPSGNLEEILEKWWKNWKIGNRSGKRDSYLENYCYAYPADSYTE